MLTPSMTWFPLFFDKLFKTQRISGDGIVNADHDDKAMYEGWLASL